MENFFTFDNRLGIYLPQLNKSWESYDTSTQQTILLHWESIRGKIPDRIKELEEMINSKQAALNKEENFQVSCDLNSDIAELASIINDLWLWYRMNQTVSAKVHQ
ncbi:hypothetical protein EJF36_15440 [Bacillus sp. HMF5848]|uniref:hypothetical protein n=1 Tax=Bacillus sp. HMF5848 TaxID=2495421 RepID=UPI000F7AEF19|nr:hypothetical protein [Bacillus sp. HMF5848]RSK28163.1 hypothetical protein EJF36_15440 [Bacillus sp. HMF5848]